MGNFYTDVITKDTRFLSTDRIDDPALLEPTTRTAVAAIISDARAMSISLRILETYRSEARQKLLFNQHLTQLENVGVHHYGLACDLARETITGIDWKDEDYIFLVGLCQKHGLISGIDWGKPYKQHSFRDWDHVQRIAVARQTMLFAGSWYPDALYNPYKEGG